MPTRNEYIVDKLTSLIYRATENIIVCINDQKEIDDFDVILPNFNSVKHDLNSELNNAGKKGSILVRLNLTGSTSNNIRGSQSLTINFEFYIVTPIYNNDRDDKAYRMMLRQLDALRIAVDALVSGKESGGPLFDDIFSSGIETSFMTPDTLSTVSATLSIKAIGVSLTGELSPDSRIFYNKYQPS